MLTSIIQEKIIKAQCKPQNLEDRNPNVSCFCERMYAGTVGFLFFTDVGRISGVVEEAENSEDVESSPAGV